MNNITHGAMPMCAHGCLGKDTLIIMQDNTSKKISDICTGDIVMGFNNALLMVNDIVSGNEVTVINITTTMGNLKLSPMHPVITKDGIKQARSISETDQLLCGDGDYVNVLDIHMEEYNDKIYNVNLGDFTSEDLERNKMIANGIVVGDALLQNKMSFMDVHDYEKQN